jgi:hypothetical protein
MPHYHDPKENNDNFWTMNVNKKAKLQTNMKTNSTLKDQIIEGIISRENDYRRFFKEKNVVQNEASKISRNDLFGGPSKEGASKEGASSVLRYTNAMNEIIINNIDSLRLLKSEADNKIKKKFDNIEKIFIRNKIQLKKNPSMINFVFTSEQIEIMLGEIIKQTNQGISDEIKEKYFQNEISTKENKSLIGSFLSGVKNFIPIGSSNTPNK